MGRRISILTILMQCIVGGSWGWAGNTGHTANNGGGLGEIAFTDVWKNLDQTLAPCLSSANLCNLSPKQIQGLRSALVRRSTTALDHPSNRFYSASGEPLNRKELTQLALSRLLGCEATLSGLDIAKLSAEALEITYFSEFPNGLALTLVSPRLLLLSNFEGKTDLTKMLRQKLRVATEMGMQVTSVWSYIRGGVVDIHGVVQLDPLTRANFQIRVNDGNIELMVYL